jgi:hypothetical protein
MKESVSIAYTFAKNFANYKLNNNFLGKFC